MSDLLRGEIDRRVMVKQMEEEKKAIAELDAKIAELNKRRDLHVEYLGALKLGLDTMALREKQAKGRSGG